MIIRCAKVFFGILVLAFGFAACSTSPNEASPASTEQKTTPTIAPTMSTSPTFLPEETPPSGAQNEFATDFSKHTVPYSEILSGGPPKDGIPAIDDPKYVSVNEADEWLDENEPVIIISVEDEARAYPIQILMWHEIVNDTLGEKPLIVTFCPLCNTAIAFERTMDEQVFDFGTTGRLRFSNLIMYDRQTETWWQQATGDAIAGELAGTQLSYYPALMTAWGDFKREYPDGSVLSRETGYSRNYGRNPYAGYDDINQSPFLFQGDLSSSQLPPMARVLTLELDGEAVAYPYEVLSEVQIINDVIANQPVLILWTEGTSSALDTGVIASGRDVGAAVAYSRMLKGEELDFMYAGGKIIDEQTGSTWNILGEAVNGELEGQQLNPVISINHFWFSWAAFRPETDIYQP